MVEHPRKRFNAFLSHSHEDAAWVEELACRLEDNCGFGIWLDKWTLVPGRSWQQDMEKGLDGAETCAVCLGRRTPSGWFRQEIERALEMQVRDPSFRVIPVLLPEADLMDVPTFLSLKTWADFRLGKDQDYAFHVLRQGIRGEPIGRWPPKGEEKSVDQAYHVEQKIKELGRFEALGLSKEVKVEFERRLLEVWLVQGRSDDK